MVHQALVDLIENEKVYDLVFSINPADGTEQRFISSYARLVKDESGKSVKVIGVLQDITERHQSEEEIKRQLKEKEVILKEVHHRIKNNLASVVSLLNLQYHSVTNPEAQATLKDAIGRVNIMQLLYEKLLQTDDYRESSIEQYLVNLIDNIIQIFPGKAEIKVETQIDDFQLDPKRMVPIGIIVNELLTNIIKYAFIGRDSGLIEIVVKARDSEITLTLQDNGTGLPADFDINNQKGFGLMLIRILSDQLDGSFSMENNNGTRSVLKFNI